MPDIEFTIENNALYFLQTRSAKRTAKAALNVAMNMMKDGLISEEGGYESNLSNIESLLHPSLTILGSRRMKQQKGCLRLQVR